ncbi:MAG TPA: hypothetical protein PLT64_07265 [Syntrophales bacterium]|nr:hypothetical protein [Syntrophales bacterium]HOL59651.1 hypothetical protein [Syntrophales bacterium]HPO35797.1 hypothetical protein [Syntrophales bacterium]
MRKLILFISCLLILISCGGPPAPGWLSTAVSRLDQFKAEYLGGRMDVAEMNYNLALTEIKKSGNMEVLGRAYLTKMALGVALLDSPPGEDFLAIQTLFPSAQNGSYYALLQGRFTDADPKALPEAYTKFAAACARGDEKTADTIVEIKDPLSRLIACGIFTLYKGDKEEVLKMAVETASHQGWKRALTVYLKRLAAYYERMGRAGEAERMRSRLSLMGP